MYASASRWLVRFTSRPEAALRLICFSHAGGSASAYRDWATDLPDRIEVVAVEYPGRGSQIAEPACTAMADLAEAATEALSPLTERPYALFGHSMGAAAAYETALRLREQEKPEPVRLVVSGREPPQHSHGCTVHLGRPELIGIEDLARPDYGDAIAVADDELPVFWACGVTPQAVVAAARPAFCITHAPGCMLVTDRLNHELAS